MGLPMSAVPQRTSDLEAALAHASRLISVEPLLAIKQAEEILRAVPNQANALMLLALAQNAAGQTSIALDTFAQLTSLQPRWPAAYFEYAQVLGKSRQYGRAIAALENALALKPDLPKAWLSLGDCYSAIEDQANAQNAYAQHVRYSVHDPELLTAAVALTENNIPVAERVLKQYLQKTPTDVVAIRMLAEVAARLGRNEDAEMLLERCMQIAPNFKEAKQHYALVLHRTNKPELALLQVDELLRGDPDNPGNKNLKAVLLCRVGDYDQAIQLYEEILKDVTGQAKIWLSFGHALKTAGYQERAVAAYQKCNALEPSFGEAYWSLANLKTHRFSSEDVVAMEAQLSNQNLSIEDRFHFEFSLAKAREDEKHYESSFKHYLSGNSLRRSLITYGADEISKRVEHLSKKHTKEFFSQRNGLGCRSQDPIFVIGMPRAGSTLIEQILSSHSQVEGTMELPEIISITRRLRLQADPKQAVPYIDLLAELNAKELEELGLEFIERTRVQRKTDAPFFIDKMPNNFSHIGLIHLMLPNAKIIDARRHPLACCFSNFKQHFARGQNFSYSLEELGRYYHDYVKLMAHYDAVLPGRIHRVYYESMVENTEMEVRRMLDYCGLPFEQNCLRFFENNRPVRTASSEQVRQPIYKEGIDHWQHFEPWLHPLKQALGPVLANYPDVPVF